MRGQLEGSCAIICIVRGGVLVLEEGRCTRFKIVNAVEVPDTFGALDEQVEHINRVILVATGDGVVTHNIVAFDFGLPSFVIQLVGMAAIVDTEINRTVVTGSRINGINLDFADALRNGKTVLTSDVFLITQLYFSREIICPVRKDLKVICAQFF